jgi:hypothetical protein
MKWLIGGLVLGVVWAVASGRVPIVWVVYCFAVLFLSMGLAVFFAFMRNRHYGLLTMGITYTAAAILAIVTREWWPLVAGFALVWALRMMGMEPEPESLPDAQAPTSTGEGEKKN